MRSIQVLVLFSVFINDFDPFESADWVEVPAVGNATTIMDGAARLVNTATSLIWEAMPCAAPNISGVTVSVRAECISCDADYCNQVTPAEANLTGWSPDLHALVVETSKEVNSDLVDLLTDLAAAHFDGTASEGGGRYVIRNRG